MTDIDTADQAEQRRWHHPAIGRTSSSAIDEPAAGIGPSVEGPAVVDGATVVHLNDAATIYEALADEIAGTAVGWSAGALVQLEQGLLRRYGALIGGRHPVRRLVRLASRPPNR